MRFLLFISLLISFSANAQFGNRNFFGVHSTSPPPSEGFDWDNLTPSAPLNLDGHSGSTVIDGVSISNPNMGVNDGYAIQISGTGIVRIKNSYIGAGTREGIDIQNFTGDSIIIENCLIANVKAGVYALNAKNVMVRNCQFVNMWGAKDCRGQFVQFNNVSGTRSGVVSCRGINFRGESYQEDMISLYQSNGSSGNPIRITDNLFSGMGPSRSGGGIMTGDNGGSWQLVENNKLYTPGNYIYAISNGTNIVVQNNMGYQPLQDWSNIGCYAYKVVGGYSCSNLTVTGNSIFIRDDIYGNNKWYAGDAAESCGSIVGIGGTDPFLLTNLDDLTEAEMNFPSVTNLITYVTEDNLWVIRGEGSPYWNMGGDCEDGNKPAQLPRPTANAGVDQSINVSTATLNGSGSTSTDGNNYKWVIVSGPNTPTMSAPLAVTNNLSGLIDGVYVVRLEDCNNSNACDADWLTITVNLP